MHVGFVGGLGLSLANFMQMKAHGAQKFYETKESILCISQFKEVFSGLAL